MQKSSGMWENFIGNGHISLQSLSSANINQGGTRLRAKIRNVIGYEKRILKNVPTVLQANKSYSKFPQGSEVNENIFQHVSCRVYVNMFRVAILDFQSVQNITTLDQDLARIIQDKFNFYQSWHEEILEISDNQKNISIMVSIGYIGFASKQKCNIW